MIKYKIQLFNNRVYRAGIEKIEVERETDSSVWIKGKKGSFRKRTENDNYYDSFEEAKDVLLKIQTRHVQWCEEDLLKAKDKLREIGEVNETK